MISDNAEKAPNEQVIETQTVSDEEAVRLHHRSALGEKLSPEEKTKLQEWYEMQDRLEAEQLGLVERRRSVAELERRIAALVQQISETIRLNDEIAAHNAAMLSEMAALKNALLQAHST